MLFEIMRSFDLFLEKPKVQPQAALRETSEIKVKNIARILGEYKFDEPVNGYS